MNRFLVFDKALEVIGEMRTLDEAVAKRDRDLASQLRRAGSSIPLNLAEGARRVGADRLHHYRIAAGSAAEVRAALAVANAWGYLRREDTARVMAQLDEILAMLWAITHRAA